MSSEMPSRDPVVGTVRLAPAPIKVLQTRSVVCIGYRSNCSCPECMMLDALATSDDAVCVAAERLLASGALDD